MNFSHSHLLFPSRCANIYWTWVKVAAAYSSEKHKKYYIAIDYGRIITSYTCFTADGVYP